MSKEQLKAFLEKVKGDTSLQDKLEAAADSDAVLAIAKEAGFMITAEDLKKAQAEVSDEELEGAAGGTLAVGHSTLESKPLHDAVESALLLSGVTDGCNFDAFAFVV